MASSVLDSRSLGGEIPPHRTRQPTQNPISKKQEEKKRIQIIARFLS